MRGCNTRNIIVYRDFLLPPSETFIKAQADQMEKYNAYYVGSRVVKGLELPTDKVKVLDEGNFGGRVREVTFKMLSLVPRLKVFRSFEPRLVHAHFGPDGVLALPLAKKLGVPLVVTFHGFDATMKDEFVHNSFYSHRRYIRERNILQRDGAMFIAVSNFIKSKMLEQGYPEEKIVQHYIGIDLNQYIPDMTFKREPIVLFVGRLVEKKGLEYLIKAMSKIQLMMPDVGLVVIGDGPLKENLQRLAESSLIKYQFLGTQSPTEVRTWMNRARVFSVPSITAQSGDSEGFGMVFAEANAMGLPVVSFASGGIPEAVVHNETGLLAEEKDWQGLASYIQRLLTDDEEWLRLSVAGKDRVKRLFDLKKQTRVLEELYDQVVQQSFTKY